MRPEREWERESELALRAVSAVSDLLRHHPEKIITRVKKNPREVVTELDVAIEKQIMGILAASKYPVLGEETHSSTPDSPPPPPPFWCVDPIDGTANYVGGVPLYAVSVGLFDGHFVTGAVSLPAFKELYFTHHGRAFLNGRLLQVADAALRSSLVVECFAAGANDERIRRGQYDLFGRINEASRGCLRLGSAAVSLCYLAAGRVQGVCGIANEIWDVAAGLAIAAQAGCRLYYHVVPNSTKVHYVVGTPTAVEEILPMCQASGLNLFPTTAPASERLRATA